MDMAKLSIGKSDQTSAGSDRTRETERNATNATPKQGTLDTDRDCEIVGHAGEQNGPVYKITLGRDDLDVKEMGATINARMGLNTWAAFVEPMTIAAVCGRYRHAGD